MSGCREGEILSPWARRILKGSHHERGAMADNYIVELKDSVFRETPLTEADFDENRRIVFASKADGEAWVTEQNRRHASMGQLTRPCLIA